MSSTVRTLTDRLLQTIDTFETARDAPVLDEKIRDHAFYDVLDAAVMLEGAVHSILQDATIARARWEGRADPKYPDRGYPTTDGERLTKIRIEPFRLVQGTTLHSDSGLWQYTCECLGLNSTQVCVASLAAHRCARCNVAGVRPERKETGE